MTAAIPSTSPGGPVEPGDALQEQVANGGRQLLAAAGRHELLDEERVALGASRDSSRQTRRRFLAEDQADEVAVRSSASGASVSARPA